METITQVLHFRTTAGLSEETVQLLDRCVETFSKWSCRALEMQAEEFKHFLEPFLSFFLLQMQSAMSKKLVIHAMVFFHQALGLPAFREPEDNPGRIALNGFFEQNAAEVGRLLLQRYLLFGSEELAQWQEDSEQFAKEELRGAWLDNPRATAEVLWGTVLRKQPDQLTPMIIEMAQQLLNNIPEPMTDDHAAYLAVCYFVISSAHYELRGQMTFNQLLHSYLLRDAANPDPRFDPVRQRITLVICEWTSSIDDRDAPPTYDLLLDLMESDDYLISLFAALALRTCLDLYSLDLEIFFSYIERTVSVIVNLIRVSEELVTSKETLAILTMVAKRAGDKIQPFVGVILKGMQDLWSHYKPGEAGVLKAEIIETMCALAKAVSDSTHFYDLFLPVLEFATDPNQPDFLSILPKALNLWYNLILFTPLLSDQHPLLINYDRLEKLVSARAIDCIESAMRITKALLAKAPNDFLSRFTNEVIRSVHITLSQPLKITSLEETLSVLSTIIILFPPEAPKLETTLSLCFETR